ncbi:hypothetical protein EGW08_015615 [Elysia chlorotica]|uniref:BZIP domain-containing protein n=1 Tax=Elysia chlorotica TaxID=188477 RepID=A0A433T4W7_ELYCH|nr:hypothetical protein EGW08_015615 [Elysia chlorotica]
MTQELKSQRHKMIPGKGPKKKEMPCNQITPQTAMDRAKWRSLFSVASCTSRPNIINSGPKGTEEKRKKNREYARTSRMKKANQVSQLKEENIQQEAIIEIYKKVLSIYHYRLHGTSITWSEHHLKWYPTHATRNSPPIDVKCYLPEHDEDFLTKVGNSILGNMLQAKTEPIATHQVGPVISATESHGNKNCISASCSTYVTKGNENLLKSDINPIESPASSCSNLVVPPKPHIDQFLTSDTVMKKTDSTNSAEYPLVQINVEEVKRETLDYEVSPQLSEKSDAVYIQPLNNENLLQLISGTSQNQAAATGQPCNIIYVVTQPKNLKRTLDEPLTFSVDKTEVVAGQIGMNGPKMMRVADGNPVPNLNISPSVIPDGSQSNNKTAFLNSAQCATSIQEVESKKETQSDPSVTRHPVEIPNESSNILLQRSMPENKSQENTNPLMSFPARNIPTQLPVPNSRILSSATFIQPSDTIPCVSAPSRNISLIDKIKPQLSNGYICDKNQGAPGPMSSPCTFKEHKTIPSTFPGPINNISYNISHESQCFMQVQSHQAENKFDDISSPSKELHSQLRNKSTSAVTSTASTANPVELVQENGNISFMIVNSEGKASRPNLLPVTSYSGQGDVTFASQSTVASQSSHVGMSVSAPPVSSVPEINPLETISKGHVLPASNAVLASPDGSQYFSQIFSINTNSTSGLSSLSSYITENDHVDVESLKATFPDQT